MSRDEVLRNAELAIRAEAAPDVALADDLIAFLRRFLVISEAQAIAIRFYVIHTHAFEAAQATPYVHVTAATAEAGKTRVLDVLAELVRQPLPTANASPAALFRSIADDRPTLLIDEVDGVWKRNGQTEENDELRRLLNAGYTMGTPVLRCVGEGARQRVERFDVFSPKVLAGIGALPRTLTTRSLPIKMKRKTREERVERWNIRTAPALAAPLRERAATWAGIHLSRLAERQPALPNELTDRQQDVAEPLLAIADVMGGEWPRRLRTALVELFVGAAAVEDDDPTRLLADIRDVFDRLGDRISTATLLAELREIEGAPWHAWWSKRVEDPAKSAAMKLGRQLRDFDVRAKTLRFEDGTRAKGFEREQLEDAWKRYLPSERTQGRDGRDIGVVEPKTTDSRSCHATEMSRPESDQNPHEQANGTTVTTSGSKDGGRPLLGDPGYPRFIADAGNAGHLVGDEFRPLLALHRLVEEARAA